MAKGDVTRTLDEIGIDEIVRMILEGDQMHVIARAFKCSPGMLTQWISKDDKRSACAREARAATAQMWEEKAETVLKDAKDAFELAKARELAHHYRWRAAKINPRQFGEKVDVGIGGIAGAPSVKVSIVRAGGKDDL
ncbi:hypothetical protein AWB64_00468 [Caballeronia sordidicola]|uniref:Uncharacterized protein n=1 Tax=Caballeronia sordidicola TaxID=196367 RepID=A0A158EWY2_CABSO|nr:hypothetical protein AWB64_00468 [Caballeronia sordidicola]